MISENAHRRNIRKKALNDERLARHQDRIHAWNADKPKRKTARRIKRAAEGVRWLGIGDDGRYVITLDNERWAKLIVEAASTWKVTPGENAHKENPIPDEGLGIEAATEIFDIALADGQLESVSSALEVNRRCLGRWTEGNGDPLDTEYGIWAFFRQLNRFYENGEWNPPRPRHTARARADLAPENSPTRDAEGVAAVLDRLGKEPRPEPQAVPEKPSSNPPPGDHIDAKAPRPGERCERAGWITEHARGLTNGRLQKALADPLRKVRGTRGGRGRPNVYELRSVCDEWPGKLTSGLENRTRTAPEPHQNRTRTAPEPHQNRTRTALEAKFSTRTA